MKIEHITTDKINDITELVTKTTWSGDKRQAARTLDIGLMVSPTDEYLPKVNVAPGEMLRLIDDDGKEVFQGYVFFREKSRQANEMQIKTYDGLIYLTKSKISKNIKNMTTAQAVKSICNELGVAVGTLADDSVKQNIIIMKKSAYETIMTLYTNMAKRTGKKYLPRMIEGKLHVIECGAYIIPKIFQGEVDLTDDSYSEDITNMINRVRITDEYGNYIGMKEKADWRKQYGVLQDITDKKEEAEKLFKDIERSAKTSLLGDMRAVTGNGIQIKDEFTGLTGLFYIDSDTHTWENGQHTCNLSLNFQNIMDEQQVQEEEKT